jgi:hypothetical protein
MLSSLAPLKEARLLFQRSIQTHIKDKGVERHTGTMKSAVVLQTLHSSSVSMESCCQYGSKPSGTDRGTIAKEPMQHEANENDEKEPQNVKQGCCVHGFGKYCAMWCSQSCRCGGHTFQLIMPKAELLFTPPGLADSSEEGSGAVIDKAKEAPEEQVSALGVVDEGSKRTPVETFSKWAHAYLKDMVVGKDPVGNDDRDPDEDAEDKQENVDEGTVAATAMAVMVAVLRWLERVAVV